MGIRDIKIFILEFYLSILFLMIGYIYNLPILEIRYDSLNKESID